jgi:hypothetical protein
MGPTIDSMSTATISDPKGQRAPLCSKASTWPNAAEALAQAHTLPDPHRTEAWKYTRVTKLFNQPNYRADSG